MADTPAPRTEPVLTITTIANTVPIVIDARTYELRHPFGLPMARYAVIRQIGVDIEALENKRRLSDTEEARLSELYAELVSMILIAPDEVKARLNDLQRGMIFTAFIELRLQRPGAATEAPTPRQSTGAKRSPDSRGSTAAHRPTGSSASPLAS